MVMTQLSDEEQLKISKFVELFLTIILHGFDEMEMKYRLELVKSLGFIFDLGVNKTIGRIGELERRMDQFEELMKKDESSSKKK